MEKQPSPTPQGGRPPKFDYDSDEFYDEIFALAYNGLTDAEIADGLLDKFKVALHPETFRMMKSGQYAQWTKEQNDRRGARIIGVLERARRKNISIVRGRYLKAALGGIKLKTTSKVSKAIKIDGVEGETELVQTTTTESETAPNLQALATWLHHHDKEWRKKEGIVLEDFDDDPQGVPTQITQGIDITKWIDQEVKAKEAMERESSEEDPGI